MFQTPDAEHLDAFLAAQSPALSHVRKRDGREVPFAMERLVTALRKAGEATGEYDAAVATRLAYKTYSWACRTLETPCAPVEALQDLCEEILLDSPFRKSARAFILYREQHKRLRELEAAADIAKVDDYLERLDWEVRENANMSFSLQGLNHYLSSSLSRSYWLRKVYSEPVREAHLSGDLHVHDLNQLSVYCVGWDLLDLLKEGFRGVSGKIESRPARHLRTALGQVVNFFYTLQGEAAGAQAFSSFDTLLAPFIRYDNLSDAELRQALQEFLFNVNVPTRVGFQTPFTNITLDLTCPQDLRAHPVLRGGELQPECYGDFQEEMHRFNAALFDLYAEGDARGRVFTFPIPTINLTRDFPWEAPQLEGLWRMTGTYGIPYFSNFINSDLDPGDARSMCCRLRIDNNQLKLRGGGLFGAHPLTGSIGVVTLNLPRLGHLAADSADFKARLFALMDLARDSLEVKRKVLERLAEGQLYPYTRYYLRHVRERSGATWTNHFSTIGLVGLHEACLNLLGQGIETEAGQAFARDVLDAMRGRLEGYQQATGHLYNLEATPGESTAHRFARADQERWGAQMPAFAASEDGAEAAPYYTNSSHLPVGHTDDLFAVLDHQDPLQTRYTGGTVIHLFLGERVSDPQVVARFVRRVAEGYTLPYFSLTPTFSVCPEHGYLAGEQHTCPICGSATEVYSRVVGYLRPVQQWNAGKQAEFRDRRPAQVAQVFAAQATAAVAS